MGSSAAVPRILSRITRLLEDSETSLVAAWAVRSMGPSAMTGEILDGISKLLEDDRGYVRDAAAGAVEAMGIRLFRKRQYVHGGAVGNPL
jgi:hypothetical protein